MVLPGLVGMILSDMLPEVNFATIPSVRAVLEGQHETGVRFQVNVNSLWKH